MGSGLTQSHCPSHCNRGTASSSENGELCKTSGQFIEDFRQVTTKNPAVRQQVAFSGGECRDDDGPEKSTGSPFQNHSEHCKKCVFCGILNDYTTFSCAPIIPGMGVFTTSGKAGLQPRQPLKTAFSVRPPPCSPPDQQSFPRSTLPPPPAIAPHQTAPDIRGAATQN